MAQFQREKPVVMHLLPEIHYTPLTISVFFNGNVLDLQNRLNLSASNEDAI